MDFRLEFSDRLLAFIVDNVQQLVIPKVGNRTVRFRLYAIVNEAYFGSFTREYNAGVVRDLVWLESAALFSFVGA